MSSSDFVTETARPTSLDHFSAVDLADLLMLALVVRGAGGIVMQPEDGRHTVRYENGDSISTFASIDSALADAVAARLAIVANLPVGSSESQVGRLRVRLAGRTHGHRLPAVELLLAIRGTPNGLVAEMHRLGSSSGTEMAPSEPFSQPDAESEPLWVGKYRVIGEIGRGGMGIVFRAEHVALQKEVAIKVLGPDAGDNPILAAQFLVEARAACRARHPGIVDVTDFGALSDGRSYIVMELVDGPTLSTVVKDGPLEPKRAVAIAHGIASAMRAAAAQGVVHRDLTPANVFVLEDDRVKVGDFGLARIIDPKAADLGFGQNHAIMGTVTYMSPEQGRGEAADCRSDVYSLGCVLFKMLTGNVPFAGTTMVAILAQHSASAVPPILGRDGPVPDVLQRVVKRAMAKRREERHQNFDELIADLEEVARTLSRPDWRRWLPR